jgi:hypothetical protein
MSQVDQNVHARLHKRCPICNRYRHMSQVDLRDDGLGWKWVCNPVVPDGRGGYDVAGCGWSER